MAAPVPEIIDTGSIFAISLKHSNKVEVLLILINSYRTL
jgi:hypothetical protein